MPKGPEKIIPENAPEKEPTPEKPELDAVVEREGKAIEKFFGQKLDVPPLPREITPERYKEWKKKEFELHYLPPEDLTRGRDLPGWKKKPDDGFFDDIKEGNLRKDSDELPGAWILIDDRKNSEPIPQ